MSYMAKREPTKLEDCPPSGPLFLNVDTKREGRLVADLQEHLGPDEVRLVNVMGAAVGAWCVRVFEVTAGWRGLRRVLVSHHARSHDYMLVDDVVLKPAGKVEVDLEDDEEVVGWFAEQQAAATASHVGRTAATADPASEGDLIFARHGGLRSRAWRGGGTMRRR